MPPRLVADQAYLLRRRSRAGHWRYGCPGRGALLGLHAVEHSQRCIHAGLRRFPITADHAKLRVAAAEEEASAVASRAIVVIVVAHAIAATTASIIIVGIAIPAATAIVPIPAIEVITISR